MKIHTPVLLSQTVELIVTDTSGIYVDCTLGTGGHAAGIAERLSAQGLLFGIDKDKSAIETVSWKDSVICKTVLINDTYANIRKILFKHGIRNVHGILLDLGVSTGALDDPRRGFSFQEEGPLDMRFDLSTRFTARDLIRSYTEAELTSLFRIRGEERHSSAIAKAIVRERKQSDIATTTHLRSIIESLGVITNPVKTCARIFQALRIEVNREIEALQLILELTPDLLFSGGRIVIISYHSIEDRIVKQFFRRECTDCLCPPEFPVCRCHHSATFKPVTRKPVVPPNEEIFRNPRARSAKLRAYQRV